jgi:hypothetical protein
MQTEFTEQMHKLDRISFLESFITNGDTIAAINEAVEGTSNKSFATAKEMLDYLDGEVDTNETN